MQESFFHLTVSRPLFLFVADSFGLGLFGGRHKVSEFLLGGPGHPDLEGDPNDQGGSSSNTVKPSLTNETSSYTSASRTISP
jgi:hypothetical protein